MAGKDQVVSVIMRGDIPENVGMVMKSGIST
jgi:hypothetical protein